MAARGLTQQPCAQGYYSIQDQYEIPSTAAKKYTALFNESAAIGFLEPFRDAVPWVRRLHRTHGYRFTVITSLSEDPYAVQLRRRNLISRFGKVFEDIICLPTGSDKYAALEPYRDTGMWWVEDKPENAIVGAELGLRSILLEHEHNRDFDHALIYRAKTWKDIYYAVTGQLS